MHCLKIAKDGKATRMFLDGFELQHVTGYTLNANAGASAQLQITLLVQVGEIGCSDRANDLRGNVGV